MAIIGMGCVLGYLLLVGVYCIDTSKNSKIYQHAVESANTMLNEGLTHYEIDGYENSRLDNSTDILMLNIAVCDEGSSNPFLRAANNYGIADAPDSNTLNTYVEYLYEGNVDEIFEYPRYWHGYLIVLKPLLYFLNLDQIRICIMFFHLLCGFLIAAYLGKRNKSLFVIPYLILWFLCGPMALFKSLQYNAVFSIANVSAIVFLMKKETLQQRGTAEFFLIIGISTSYFDFLTFPVISLIVPLTLWIVLDDDKDLYMQVKRIILYSVSWGIGYAGMWTSKWILATIVTGKNIIYNGLSSVKGRSSNILKEGGESISLLSVLKSMLNIYWHKIIVIILFGCFLFLLCRIINNRKNIKCFFSYIIRYGIVSVIPIFWYLGTTNHTMNHAYFTSKSLAGTVFALYCLLVQCGEKMNNIKDWGDGS